MTTQQSIQLRWESLRDVLDERQRRLWAAAEARALGRGGIARVAEATGLSRRTIGLGQRELQSLAHGQALPLERGRIRQRGGGRKPTTVLAPNLLDDLEALLMPELQVHARSPLRWTCDGTAKLAALLKKRGHSVGPRLVARLLRQLGYNLRASRMPAGSGKNPDRETQFEYLNSQVASFHGRGQPVVAVTTSCKECSAELVDVAESPEDLETNQLELNGSGESSEASPWVAASTDHDLADFVVALVRFWWFQFGLFLFPKAKELLLVADCAGTHGETGRLWKLAIQRLADATGLTMAICYFPPGTSRWSQVDQRLGSQLDIEENDKIVRLQATAQVIGDINPVTRLSHPEFKRNRYRRVLNLQKTPMTSVHLEPASCQGHWNYAIRSHDITLSETSERSGIIPQPK